MKRLALPRLTIRARLTLVYGGLLLIAGLLLLGVTYVLVATQPPAPAYHMSTPPSGSSPGTTKQAPQAATGPASPPANSAQRSVEQVTTDVWNDARKALLTQGGIALAVVGTAAISLGWLVAGGLLRPLHRIRETAARIADAPAADRSLHERIALAGPRDEVKRLADTFDLMLDRLDRAFDGQRRFIANASHELRTPLTVNRALLEVALYRTPTTPEVRQLGQTLLETNTRQERLLDGLLLLARSEREVTDRSYVDLADIVEHVTASVAPGPVTVHAEAGEAPTTGNPALLERLVQNLVDNGIRHNVPGNGWVKVTTGTGPEGAAQLQVTNTGPVIPRYDMPSLFEPFHRHGTDQLAIGAPGAGLGLSIVQAVARAHGGDVHAEPRPGGGLVVTVTLPAAN